MILVFLPFCWGIWKASAKENISKNIMRSMGYVYVYIYIQPLFGNPTQLENLYPPDASFGMRIPVCDREAMASHDR